jgi:hypothetical protein
MYSRAVDGAAVASSLQQLLEEGGWVNVCKAIVVVYSKCTWGLGGCFGATLQ